MNSNCHHIKIKKMPCGIMFHHFHIDGEQHFAQGSITADDLRKIIEFIGTKNILHAHLWQEKAINNALDDGDICLTFDDALKSQIDIALKLLIEYNLTAFWFVYSSVFFGNVEKFEIYKRFCSRYFTNMESFYAVFKDAVMKSKWNKLFAEKNKEFSSSDYLKEFAFYSDMDREYRFIRDKILDREKFEIIMDGVMNSYDIDIKSMAKNLWMNNEDLAGLAKTGHVIGLHSYSHPTDLKSMDLAQQEKEYQLNKEHIKEVTGQEPLSMAHPCNSYSKNTLKLLSGMGVKLGFRSNTVKIRNHCLEHPREDHINILYAINGKLRS